jgi:RNA polymerase primary sigma factor
VEILTKEALREALENLGYRERRVLELRYGLGGEHPRTLDEVGRAFNVTRERIRQIESQSLKKLQNLHEAQKLRDDLETASGFALRRLADRP